MLTPNESPSAQLWQYKNNWANRNIRTKREKKKLPANNIFHMCVILCLFSTLSRRAGALQISIIIINNEIPPFYKQTHYNNSFSVFLITSNTSTKNEHKHTHAHKQTVQWSIQCSEGKRRVLRADLRDYVRRVQARGWIVPEAPCLPQEGALTLCSYKQLTAWGVF